MSLQQEHNKNAENNTKKNPKETDTKRERERERWKMLAGMAASTINTSAVAVALRNSLSIVTPINVNSIQLRRN